MLTFYSIMKSCKRHSNWMDLEKDPYFPMTEPIRPWAGIYEVHEFLLKANKLSQCLAFLRIASDLLGQNLETGAWSDFIDLCDSRASVSHEQLSLLLLNSRIYFAEILMRLKSREQAQEQLRKIEMELKVSSWILASDYQALKFRQLQADFGSERKMEDLPKQIEIITLARRNDDRLLETQTLANMFLVLNQVPHLDRDAAWLSLFESSSARYTELHADPRGNVLLACGALSRMGNTFSSTKNSGEYLRQLSQFERKFPSFDIPSHREELYHAATYAAQYLGKSEESQIYFAKQASASLNSPLDPSQFFKRYREQSPSEWPKYLMEIMMGWLTRELEMGSFSAKEVASLLCLDLPNENGNFGLKDLVYEIQRTPFVMLASRLYGEVAPVDSDEWGVRFQRYEQWLWKSPRNVECSIRHTVLEDIQEVRCVKVTTYAQEVRNNSLSRYNEYVLFDMHQLQLKETARLLELLKRKGNKAMGAIPDHIITVESVIMSIRSNLATSVKAYRMGIIKDTDMLEAQAWWEAALLRYQPHQMYFRSNTLASIARSVRQRYIVFGTVTADAALDTFSRFDQAYMAQRRERSILRRSDNVIAQAEIVSRFGFNNHYDFSMGLCIEALGVGQLRNNYQRQLRQDVNSHKPIPLPIRNKEDLFAELISWAQRKKSRSVTEVLGAEVIIPRKALLNLDNDIHAIDLLQKESEIQRMLDEDPSDPTQLSLKLEDIRQDMRECVNLEEVMDIRDGQAMTWAQVQSLSKELGPRVTIVDYIHLPQTFTGIASEILPLIYKNGHLCSTEFIGPDLDYAKLELWVRTFMDQEEPLSTEEGAESLAMLAPLILPAVKISDPGDTILLCPTGILFGIPLHAIEIDDRPLTERNPVVYTQSLSILRICQLSASSLDLFEAMNPLAIQALPTTESALSTAPTMGFAKRLNARVLAGHELTRDSMLDATLDSSLIHFYGHVGFDEKTPLDHYMAIRGLETERVTARHIFSHHLRSGTHISLIGCRSGSSRVGLNDDLLGLSTAFLFAGAGSILSALWAIRKDDAEEFQEAFYDELLKQSAENQGNDVNNAAIDLALVLQKAVVRVSVDGHGRRKAPYHWAAFMLQGCWNRFPLLTRKKTR